MSLPYKVYSVLEIKTLVDKYQIPMRDICGFYIDENYHGPNARGVFYDYPIKNWIVYKNSATREREVVLASPDESVAAQEIWSQFIVEVKKRPDIAAVLFSDEPYYEDNVYPNNYSGYKDVKPKKKSKKMAGAIFGVFAGLALIGIAVGDNHEDGYYYDSKTNCLYYHLDDDWYKYDENFYRWKSTNDSYKSRWSYEGTTFSKVERKLDDDIEYIYDFEYTTYYLKWYYDNYNPNEGSNHFDWDDFDWEDYDF